MNKRLLHKLKPITLIIGLFIVYYLYTPKSTSHFDLYHLSSIDTYSANVLRDHPNEAHFQWGQFLGLDEYFEINKNTLVGLTCTEFGIRLKKHERSRFNCKDDPNDFIPIIMNENPLLYLDDANRHLLASIYNLKTMPNPQKLVYLFKGNQLTIPVNPSPKPLVVSGSPDLSKLVSKHTNNGRTIIKAPIIDLEYEEFDYRSQLARFDLESPVSLLETQYKNLKRAGMYFTDAYVDYDQGMRDIDWRFFRNGDLFKQPYGFLHMARTSALIRAWLHFANTYGVKTWLIENTAVGWKFNGLHLPMENNLRFQISLASLMDLVDQGFNHTIIFDYTDNATPHQGAFFLDISPYIRLRDRNNKENLIDIRVIDVATGQYLEIIGVATFQYEKLYNFKANLLLQSLGDDDIPKLQSKIDRYAEHKIGLLYTKDLDIFKFEEQVSKLLPVKFENSLAYVPVGYDSLLTEKYFDAMRVNRLDWRFREFLNIWVPFEWCKPPRGNPSQNDDLICLKNSNVEQLYRATRKVSEDHNKFLKYLHSLPDVKYELELNNVDAINYSSH